MERTGVFFAEIPGDVVEEFVKDRTPVSLDFKDREILRQQRHDFRGTDRFRRIRHHDFTDAFAAYPFLHFPAVRNEPAKIFWQASQLIIDGAYLGVGPLKAAWADELVQKEISVRFQRALNLSEQMLEVFRVMDGGDPEDDIVSFVLEFDAVQIPRAVSKMIEALGCSLFRGRAHSFVRKIHTFVRPGETILTKSALELPDAASQRERALHRHLPLKVTFQEMLESIDVTRAGDFEIDPFLHQRMLKPVLDIRPAPDAMGAPDELDPIDYGTEIVRLIQRILSQLSNFSVPSNNFA